jgi:LuxR family maltose regulon positive regulatory protein
MPPARHDLVRRPRLTARLSAGLSGPLTLVVAPAGFGKTTLLADWRAAQQEDADGASWPVAWLALDAGDNDLVRFLRYLIAALHALDIRVGDGVLAGLRAPQPPVEALLTLLVNDLAALPDDVILVLDDYHAIEHPDVHSALTFLLDHLPPRLHLVLATRVEPPLPLARLRARGQLSELRASDLRFTNGEATAFLYQTMGLRLSADDMAMLDTCTEGWVAGLQLAALALQGRDPAALRAALAGRISAHRFILDYLADEVFAGQPAAMQDFLLRTAVLDRLSGPLCDALTADTDHADGATNGQAMLERLEAANLFLVPLDETRTWYRYHHLFAGFLRERLRRDAPALISTLHCRAAHWYEQQGLLGDAADHALAAQDHALAARLIEQTISTVLWQLG